jgi:acyl-CoA dehydrogenase
MRLGLSGVGAGRLFNAAKAVGLARWGIELAVDHAAQRVTFGRPLIENQAISFRLAEAATQVRAAHLLGLDCARRQDRGEPTVREAAMAKAFATEAGCRALDTAIQVTGGIGLTSELGLAEAWQELRIVLIADGSAEMMRRIIARRLTKGDVAL